MSGLRTIALTMLAMLAFAANSLLCRMALAHTTTGAASFTAIRLVSGAIILWLLVAWRGRVQASTGNWRSAFALFAYAAGFSFAYISLTAATGALLLFGAVQVTMIGHGLWRGERLRMVQVLGCAAAFAGLVGLLLPGLSAPPLGGAVLMLGAGFAWGVYSLRGRQADDPVTVTAGNFARAVPFALLLALALWRDRSVDGAGIAYAIASGALASGMGYVIWYAALPRLRPTSAAIVQLSVPLLAAAGGVVILGEPLTLRLVVGSIAILGGIALVTMRVGQRLDEAARQRR
jgi:drug/metabolite transporter (DMT)-like permease